MVPHSFNLSVMWICPSRFSSVGRASDSQIFWEHEFESRQPHLCNSMWGQDWWQAGCQEVGTCSARGGSQGTYITFSYTMQIRQPTLALKPRGDITRNPKQGYQWPQNRTHVSAQKTLKKKCHVDFGWWCHINKSDLSCSRVGSFERPFTLPI